MLEKFLKYLNFFCFFLKKIYIFKSYCLNMALAMPKKITIALLVILILAIVSYTADVSISTYRYPAYHGVYFGNLGNFTVVSNGFFVAAYGMSRTLSCDWVLGMCSTGVAEGNWYYNITLIANFVATGSMAFNVTVKWDYGFGYTVMGEIMFIMREGQGYPDSLTLIFDTGGNSFYTPIGIVIIVEQIYP